MEKERFIQWLQREIEHAQQSLKEIEAFEAMAEKGDPVAVFIASSKKEYEDRIKSNSDILSRVTTKI